MQVISRKANYYNNNIQKTISLLEKSRRPLIAVGLTAARLDLKDELALLLDMNKIPVVITPMAKGIISEDHPCYAGVLFHALSDYLEDIYEKNRSCYRYWLRSRRI